MDSDLGNPNKVASGQPGSISYHLKTNYLFMLNPCKYMDGMDAGQIENPPSSALGVHINFEVTQH